MDLDKLGIKYGTDKSSNGHWYTRYYADIFGPTRKQVESVLELGVGSGCSIRMWKDYFQNAFIYGLDQNHVTGDFGSRVHILQCDQADEKELVSRYAEAKLEIVIDDCSHEHEKTMTSLKCLFPRLQPAGWYVVEDMDGGFCAKLTAWPEIYHLARSIQFFFDKGEGSLITFIQKAK